MQASSGTCRFFSGATGLEITAVESQLGVALPHSYRHFLRMLGCGSFKGHEFYGIVPGQPISGRGAPLVVDMNLTPRQRGRISLPSAWICVAESGNGWLYVLRTDIRTPLEPDGYESPVDGWYFGDDLTHTDRMAESFAAFFEKQVGDAIVSE